MVVTAGGRAVVAARAEAARGTVVAAVTVERTVAAATVVTALEGAAATVVTALATALVAAVTVEAAPLATAVVTALETTAVAATVVTALEATTVATTVTATVVVLAVVPAEAATVVATLEATGGHRHGRHRRHAACSHARRPGHCARRGRRDGSKFAAVVAAVPRSSRPAPVRRQQRQPPPPARAAEASAAASATGARPPSPAPARSRAAPGGQPVGVLTQLGSAALARSSSLGQLLDVALGLLGRVATDSACTSLSERAPVISHHVGVERPSTMWRVASTPASSISRKT